MLPQRPSFRFLATGALVSLSILAFLLYANQTHLSASRYILKTHRPDPYSQCPSSTFTSTNKTWEFLVERDGGNHGLSEEQCRSAFPKLFVEIDQSALLRAEKKFSFKDLDSREVEDGMVRAIIDRGEVSEAFTYHTYTEILTFREPSCISSTLLQCLLLHLAPAQHSIPSNAPWRLFHTDISSPA